MILKRNFSLCVSHITTIRVATIEINRKKKYLWGYGENGTLCSICVTVKCCSHYRKQFLRIIKSTIIIWSSNSTSGYEPQRVESRESNWYLSTYVPRNMNTQQTRAGSNSSAHWCMNKQKVIYMHIVEYYTDLKRKEILTYVTTWKNFQDITLSEISSSQKDKYWVISFI